MSPQYRNAFILGVVLNLANQLTGINVIIFYSTVIYSDAGFSQPEMTTFFLGFMNFIASILINVYSN